jgi:hypothetical protein
MAIMIYKSQIGRFDLTLSQIDHTNLVIQPISLFCLGYIPNLSS